jgi:uncharacterized protein (DUF2147 family)
MAASEDCPYPWSQAWHRPARRNAAVGTLALILLLQAVPTPALSAGVPVGVWLLPSKAAVEIFDCSGLLCGRIVWLQRARNSAGELVRDKKNSDSALRPRLLCGLIVIWRLEPAGPDRWRSGWLYNPDDGRTYRVSGELRSTVTLSARIYVGIPIYGETSTWLRVPQPSSENCGAG